MIYLSLRFLLFLFGFGITVIGFSYIIMYLNLLTLGYSFFDYLKFISKRFECINIILGTIIMIVSISFKGGKNELYL